jgi:hypothetical protein
MTVLSIMMLVKTMMILNLFSPQVRALRVPPLPPNLGPLCQADGRHFSYYVQPIVAEGSEAWQKNTWKPKEGVLIGTLAEHTRAVNRLAVSQVRSLAAGKMYIGT